MVIKANSLNNAATKISGTLPSIKIIKINRNLCKRPNPANVHFHFPLRNLQPQTLWPYLQIPWRNTWTLKTLAAFRTVVFNLEVVCLFSRGRESFWQKYSYLLLYFMFLMELLFVVAKIIGSPGKNDSLLFIQNCFKCDYDHHSTEYCCVWQRTNNFVT